MSTDPAPVDPVERAIREAMGRGEFDGLPGAGKPIPGLGTGYDPDWWARRFVERARLEDAADEVRRTIRAELPRLRTMPDREAAERRMAHLEERIAALNALGLDDPIPPLR